MVYDYSLQHDCVDFWRKTVVVVPDGGMCNLSYNGERVPAAVLEPVPIWLIVIMLKPAT